MEPRYLGGNRLVDSLTPQEYAILLMSAEMVYLRPGQVTHAPAASNDYVVFPIDSVLSVITTLSDGSTCEIGMVGNEGASGVDAAFGAPVLRTTVCQVAGQAVRFKVSAFLDARDRCPGLDALIRATERARMFLVEQLVVCNVIHKVDERCARWLLMMADRAERESYSLTQEYLSYMLGVRRASVSLAAKQLHRAGAISYTHGNVRIIDRPKLESMACECYFEVTRTFDASLDFWGRRPGKKVHHHHVAS